MIGIRSGRRNAEDIRAYLKAHKLMDNQYRVLRRNSFIYFPVSGIDDKALKELQKMGANKAEISFRKSHDHKDYRQLLLSEFGATEYDRITKSYDLIGDTAVVDESKRNSVRLAKVIMSVNKNVKRVLRKSGAVSGIYRTRRFDHVAGKKGYVVRYRENGITLQLDIRKSFFSPRLAYERKRISDLVGDHENVVVMFAGAGPFALLIAKEHRRSKVVAIELNRNAYKSMVENIKINKLGNVLPVFGDVRKKSKDYRAFADRIVMPLPKDAYGFLGTAMYMAKKRCTIHYYAFGKTENPYEEQMREIRRFFAKRASGVRFAGKRVVRTYSAGEVEVVLDLQILPMKE